MDGIKGSRPPSTTALAAGGASAAPPAKASREPAPTAWAPNAATPESSAPSAIEPDVRARGLQMVQAASAGVAPQNPASSVDDAFESLQASASGIAEIRRHTDNVMAWNMKWDLVNKAQKTFDFSYFSIERDAYGLAYLGALLNARLRGVEVTGVTDYMANARGHGFASVGLGADYVQELATYGAKIGLYDKPSTRVENLFEDGASYRVISSDHDKLAVSDAGTEQAEGETGGRNVAGAYHQDPRDNPKSWRDDSVQIKGRVTDGLVVALRRELDGPAVKVVKPDVVNLDQRATEMLGAFSMMQAWLAAPPLSEAEKTALRADPTKREALAAELYANGLAALRAMPEVPARLKNKALNVIEQHNLRTCAEELAADLELRGSKARYDVLGGYITGDVKIIDQVGAASAPVGERFNEFAPSMLKLIEGTQKEIVLENPYVVLTEPMLKALEDAAKRGVQITIVTNSPESTDSAVTQGFFLNDWMRIEERVPTARIFVATGERKLHAKAFVLDGRICGDMSYNADLLSALVNGEVAAVTRSEASAQELLSRIYDDLADPANKFREWTIKRDDTGTAVRDATGGLVAERGPEHDVSSKLLGRYRPVRYLCDLLAGTRLGSPLRHREGPE